MNVREALAAQGNDPLVFMGGTCAGPKWRERLCSQVKQDYRWFNPVVDEWTEAARETECIVREEAAILLYVITPYQEGCFSFLELMEDAIKSPARTVVCFLPSFEDKAFSESQWNGIICARRSLERNQARVFLSMEELIEYLNDYNPATGGNRLLSTQMLNQYQPRPESNIQPESKLSSPIENAKAKDFTPPTSEEPGTVTATTLLGQVSSEGFIDTIKSIFKRGETPRKHTEPKPKVEKHRFLDVVATARKLSDVEWLREHWDSSNISRLKWDGLLVNGKPVDRAEDVARAIGEQLKQCKTVQDRLTDFYEKEKAVDFPMARKVVEGELEGDDIQKAIIREYGKLKLPYGNGGTLKTVFGDREYRFTLSGASGSYEKRDGKYISAGDVTPERVAAFCAGLVQAAAKYTELHDIVVDGPPLIQIDPSDQPFRAVYLSNTNAPTKQLDEIVTYLGYGEGCAAEELYSMVDSWYNDIYDTLRNVVESANSATQGAGASFESLSISSEGIIDDVVKFIKGHSTKAPEEGTDKSEHQWIVQESDTIRKTLGNPAWVKTNYHSDVSLSENTLQKLRFNGEVVKPVKGIKEGYKLLTSWTETEGKPVFAYIDKMKAIIKEAQAKYDRDEDPATIRQYLLTEGRKLKVPARKSPGPWMPGDTRLIFKDTRANPEIKPASQRLEAPELSIEDVTAAGKAIADFIDQYFKIADTIPFAGSGCDDGFWLSDDFDYELDDMDEIYEIYYFQSAPEEAGNGFNEMLWLFVNYIRAVGVWLKAYTQ